MDLLTILPEFNTKPYTHILPPLERRNISTVDLITLDYLEIAKRAHVPPADVRRLCVDVIRGLHGDLGFAPESEPSRTSNDKYTEKEQAGRDGGDGGDVGKLDLSRWNTISTLDPALDELLGGGIPTGYVTEVTGESGSGKTQFLLNLLLAAQLPSPKGLGKKAIYISTEAPLSTPRLSQMLQTHPYLSKLPIDQIPSLANVLSITAIDLETQDHILNYQLPVAISRFDVGLVIIDSIAANYRAEHASNSMQSLSARSGELVKLGHLLRNLAVREDIAVVVANQVSDRFDMMPEAYQPYHQQQPQGGGGGGGGRFPRSSQPPLFIRNTLMSTEPGDPNMRDRDGMGLPSSSPGLPSSPLPSSQLPADNDAAFDGAYIIGHPVRNETLSLAHQQKFFTGWGDEPDFRSQMTESQKTPALGFVWSTQIACRIALKKEEEEEEIDRPAAALESEKSAQVPNQAHHPQEQTGIRSAKDIAIQASSPHASSLSQNSPNQEFSHRSEHSPTTKATPPKPSITEARPQIHFPTTRRITKRRIKLVFAPWASGIIRDDNIVNNELEFEIWTGGIRSIDRNSYKSI